MSDMTMSETTSSSSPSPDKIEVLSDLIKQSFTATSPPNELKFMKNGLKNCECEGLTDEGIINYIYRITDEESLRSYVIKWATEIPKMVESGMTLPADSAVPPDLPMEVLERQKAIISVERNGRESRALKSISEWVPGFTPQIYYTDLDRHFFIMEDLKDYRSLAKLLENGSIRLTVFKKIGELVGKLHKLSHVKTLGQEKFKDMVTLLGNPVYSSVLEDFMSHLAFGPVNMFGCPRRSTQPLQRVLPQLIGNESIKEIGKTLAQYVMTNQQCFAHFDLHTGSFLVRNDDDVKVIDPEWGQIGCACKDFGHFIGETLVYYYVNECRGQDTTWQVIDAINTFGAAYLNEMKEIIDDEVEFFQYAAGFAGHQAALRVVNLPLPAFQDKEESEADCVQAALRLMNGMKNVTSLDRLTFIAFALC